MNATVRWNKTTRWGLRAAAVSGVFLLVGCTAPEVAPPAALDGPGPFGVGRTRIALDVGARVVPVEVWFPAERQSAGSVPLSTLGLDDTRRAQWSQWLSMAPSECVRGEVIDGADASPVRGGFPLIVMSHCHECSRLGAVQIAERLTAHGFVVAAPDHVGGDLFSALEGVSTGFSTTTLNTRVDDVDAVIDGLRDGEGLPSEAGSLLEGVVSASEVGLLGHSFGVTTINTVHRADDRVAALMALAGPLNVFGEAPADEVEVPLLALRSTEDNTIGTVGNDLILSQFEQVPRDKWFIDVRDAGHYSFLDICGITEQFDTGCGEDQRQTDPAELFGYLAPARARALTATYAVAFFSLMLKGDERGRVLLAESVDAAVIGPEFTAAP